MTSMKVQLNNTTKATVRHAEIFQFTYLYMTNVEVQHNYTPKGTVRQTESSNSLC